MFWTPDNTLSVSVHIKTEASGRDRFVHADKIPSTRQAGVNEHEHTAKKDKNQFSSKPNATFMQWRY